VAGGFVLLILGSLAAFVHFLIKLAWNRMKRYLFISLEVRKEDESYAWIMSWLAEMNKTHYTRDLSLITKREKGGSAGVKKPSLAFAPAPGLHFIKYQGRYISVTRTIQENQFSMGAGKNGLELNETLKLSTIGTDVGILKKLASEAMVRALGDEDGKTLIFKPTRYRDGNWRKIMAVEKRSFASVHFSAGLLEDLLEDVKEFFETKAWYSVRGIPHRRGILLHGPPGNGKSTFALTLAGQMNLNLCVCSLSDPSLDDDSLQENLRKMPFGSILLLEDIDAAFVQRNKDKHSSNKLSYSGLLNALDGVTAYVGCLVLMTTNHPERLDPALTRPGRVDLTVHIGHASREQIVRLFCFFYDPPLGDAAPSENYIDECNVSPKELLSLAKRFADTVPDGEISMASIQGHLLQNKRSPHDALDNVTKFLAREKDRLKREQAKEAEDGEKKEAEGEKKEAETKKETPPVSAA